MPSAAVRPAARAAILAWYDASGRRLPFRGLTDPYAILASEVMAQQTQVARVGPAWGAFLERFPSVEALASAPTADVLRAWRGLGYNRRAINFQRAARAIVAEHGGRFPEDVATLQRLPGIGPYTARAVAALAFGRRVGAVDTNVRRVLTRMLSRDGDVTARRLQEAADEAVPADRPADWTHALMDLGATICRGSAPRCAECPARAWCVTGRSGAARAPTFASSARWLRGRIVDRLRELPPGEWLRFAEPIGGHDVAAVVEAVSALSRDGLLERHPADAALARLPAG